VSQSTSCCSDSTGGGPPVLIACALSIAATDVNAQQDAAQASTYGDSDT
jgi:hypothetical protein